jgi:hypothetical protein
MTDYVDNCPSCGEPMEEEQDAIGRIEYVCKNEECEVNQ